MMALEGRLATVGHMDRVLSATIDLEALHAKRLKLFGVSNEDAQRQPSAASRWRASRREFLPLFASRARAQAGDRPGSTTSRTCPAAKARMEADAHVGKIVVRI